jgi:hypothetical protein
LKSWSDEYWKTSFLNKLKAVKYKDKYYLVQNKGNIITEFHPFAKYKKPISKTLMGFIIEINQIIYSN